MTVWSKVPIIRLERFFGLQKLASSDIGHDVQDLSVVDLNTDEPVTITVCDSSASNLLVAEQVIKCLHVIVSRRRAHRTYASCPMQFEELSYSVRFPVKKLSLAERIKGLSLSGFPRTEWNEKYLLQDLTGTIKVCWLL
jgi:hypothetical protein